MAESQPKFDQPPVIETVLSAQFARLPNFSSALTGWFWKKYLSDEWVKSKDAIRLDDQFERFNDESLWIPTVPFRIRSASEFENERVQIIRKDEERMIQIQDTRFTLNWRKRSGPYPTYEIFLPEFNDVFERFKAFVRDNELGDFSLNQWEVTYINYIPKGDLWQTVNDWKTILPGIYIPVVAGGGAIESLGNNWRYVLAEKRGRLYVSLQLARIESRPPDSLVLQFTARGAVEDERGWSLESGFKLGHLSIVQTFAAITSKDAQTHWRRTS